MSRTDPAAPAASALIVGATSDIARALARAYAAAGRDLVLTARDPARLDRDAADLRVRFGITVTTAALDVEDEAAQERFLAALDPLPDTAVCVVGLMTPQAEAETDPAAAGRMMRANYLGPALLLGRVAARMATRGRGTIVGISSVAGDRGRASNYVYGSAKAGFTAFLSGLRARMARDGVRVITVKPGFVRTRMTEGMKLPGALTAEPEEVARAVLAAEARGRHVVYVRPVWRGVMAVIRTLPEPVFMRLRI